METRAAQAMIRFGLGRRANEPPPADPQAWLAGQLDGPDPGMDAACHSSSDGLVVLRDFQKIKPAERAGQPNPVGALFRADTDAAMDLALTTATPFRERLVWFWANHFTVSIRQGGCAAVANAFVREAIRPHVTGRFVDMLFAVMTHPAMLMYLDNAQSIGPNSPAGLKTGRGLNENLARECLELHTVSPASGYTQADVTAFAKILTGWSVAPNYNPPGYLFRLNTHEPGAKVMMGNYYPTGRAGGVDALTWLADHPWTHRHLATKLVRHFVADDPQADDVRRVEAVLRDTHGDLKAAALELTRMPQAWQPLTKLRSPREYVIAVLRALDLPADNRPPPQAIMAGMGQPYMNAPMPNGWPDTAADWTGSDAILRRVDWAFAVSGRAADRDPADMAEASLGPLLRPATLEQMHRAGSRREALTLLLSSPEFQRR